MTVPELRVSPQSRLPTSMWTCSCSGCRRRMTGRSCSATTPRSRRWPIRSPRSGSPAASTRFAVCPPSGIAARSLALVGRRARLSGTNELRYAAGSASRQVRGVATLGLALPTIDSEQLLAVLEGAAIGAYSYLEFRTRRRADTKRPATAIVVASSLPNPEPLVERATIVATAMHSVRDLVNAPSSHLYPETFAQESVELAEGAPVDGGGAATRTRCAPATSAASWVSARARCIRPGWSR